MAIVDLNNLPIIPEEVQPDYDNYVDPSEFPPPVPDGTHSLRLTKVEFDLSDDHKVLTAIMSHDVFNGDGKSIGGINFDRASDALFDRQGVMVSMLTDQFRAFGDRNRYPTKNEKIQALQAQVGEVFNAATKQKAYCNHKDTPFASKYEGRGKARKLISGSAEWTLKGEKAMAGEHEKICPVCQTTVRVNSIVDRRIPKN